MCSMPRTTPITPVLLQFNCGFARCAVKELTAQLAGTEGKATREVNRDKRAEMFRTYFTQPSFGIPEDFFTATTTKRLPKFEDRCEAVLDAFAFRNWKSQCKRQEYLMTFTLQRWRKLTAAEKARHSLQKCMACAIQHGQLQEAFLGPTFKVDLKSMYASTSTCRKDEKAMTRQALQYVNAYHEVHTC